MKDIFHAAGWQHLRYDIPNSWDLVQEYGHKNKGYIRYDDLNQARLEIKWNRVKKSFNLLAFVTKHALEIGWENSPLKKLSDDNTIFSIENRAVEINQEVIFFKPKDPKARLSVFRLFYKPKENGRKIVKHLCDSFKDDLANPNSLWSYYENEYELPSRYEKIEAQINAGNKLVSFNHHNKFAYLWTISLVNHFCPFKPVSNSNINLWILQILKNYFKKEVELGQWDYLSNQVRTKTAVRGRLLLKNLFHLSHQWAIMAHYDGQADVLKIAIINYRNDKDINLFTNLRDLVAIQ